MPIFPPVLVRKIFIREFFLSCVNDYIEDMATLTVFAKIYSTEYFFNMTTPGLDEFFV